jgi:hypothetical protein
MVVNNKYKAMITTNETFIGICIIYAGIAGCALLIAYLENK